MQEEKVISKETQTNETQTQQQVAETTSAPAPTTTKGTKKTSPKPQKTSGKPVEKSPKPVPKAPATDKEATKKAPAKSLGTKKTSPAEPTKVVAKYIFPDTLELKGIGKLSKETTLDSFDKLFEKYQDESLVTEYLIAMYWPKSSLKKYDPDGICPAPASFPQDLDICQVIRASEKVARITYESVYTDFIGHLLKDKVGDDFAFIDIINKYKTQETCHCSNPVLWSLYHLDEVDESVDEEEAEDKEE